jgi:hypothetical protein
MTRQRPQQKGLNRHAGKAQRQRVEALVKAINPAASFGLTPAKGVCEDGLLELSGFSIVQDQQCAARVVPRQEPCSCF